MRVSAELFLLDNALMNLCIFLLAAALCGMRVRFWPLLLFSAGGAVYALLSLFLLPVLQNVWVKLASFVLLGLPLRERGTPLLLNTVCVLLSAAMVGGAVVCLTLMTGGTVQARGTVVGTVRLRTALIGLALALLLPRAVRGLLSKRRCEALYTPLTVCLNGTSVTYVALVDTGNALIEPISGLPIVLLENADVKKERVVVYRTQGGEGVLFAARPKSVRLPAYGNACVDCYVARAMQPIPGANAILPAGLLPADWRKRYERNMGKNLGETADSAAYRQKKRVLVYSHGRKPARPAQRRRGGTLHRSGEDGEVGKG